MKLINRITLMPMRQKNRKVGEVMKKFIKFMGIFLGIVIILFIVLIIATAIFFKGEEKFNAEIEGTWTTTTLEIPVNFVIFKGSRAVKGYTYGYFKNERSEDYSYHIRYKDHSLEFVENDKEQFLKYSVESETLTGKIYLPNHKTKELTPVILKKSR